MVPYKRMVDDLRKYFVRVSLQQVPRVDNKAADAMATLASLLQLPENDFRHEFLVDMLHYPAYNSPDSQMICSVIGHDSSRYHHLYSYLRDQIIPDTFSRNERRHLIRNASQYILVADDLYRRGLDGTLLRCLEPDEFKRALAEVHEGVCGSHSRGLTLARKLI